MTSPRSEFLSGVKAELPLLLGVIPFGLIYGVLALDAGLPPVAALAMSSIVFAGSSQFIGAQLIKAGALGVVIVATTFVVNLRHMLYSASLAPHLKHLRTGWKWLLAYLLTDEAYAVSITHYNSPEAAATSLDRSTIASGGGSHAADSRAWEPALLQDLDRLSLDGTCQQSAVGSAASHLEHKHWYFFGAGITLWSTWQASTAIGIFLGAQVPASWSLDFTLALTFIALVVPALKDRPTVASAVCAGIVAVLTHDLPYKLGLMLAALIGILAGLWAERRVSGALRLSRTLSRES